MLTIKPKFYSQSGASAVEFALVLPFLVLIFFAIVESAWMLSSQMMLNHCVFQAARTAAIAKQQGYSNAQASVLGRQEAVSKYWMGELAAENVVVSFDTSGQVFQVEVRAELEYPGMTRWFAPGQIPKSIAAKAVTPYQ